MKLTARIFFSAASLVRYFIYGIKNRGTKNIERCKSPLSFVQLKGASGRDLLSTLPVRAYQVTHEITSSASARQYLRRISPKQHSNWVPGSSTRLENQCMPASPSCSAARAIPSTGTRKVLAISNITSTCSNRAKTSSFRKSRTAKNTQLANSIPFLAPARMYYSRHNQPYLVPIAVNKKVRRIT